MGQYIFSLSDHCIGENGTSRVLPLATVQPKTDFKVLSNNDTCINIEKIYYMKKKSIEPYKYIQYIIYIIIRGSTWIC